MLVDGSFVSYVIMVEVFEDYFGVLFCWLDDLFSVFKEYCGDIEDVVCMLFE